MRQTFRYGYNEWFMHDVYLYGIISPSTVYLLHDDFPFPKANQYAEIKKTIPSIGGEAANTAIMLSKLGINTKMDGNWVNKSNRDEINRLLKPFNIDISRLKECEEGGTEEFIIADRTSRTVFGNYAGFNTGGKQWNDPEECDILDAKIVSLDPYLKDASLAVARLCVKNNIPYVTIDCRHDDFISQNAEAVIISHELRSQAYAECDAGEIFSKYRNKCRGLVIITYEGDELVYGRKGEGIHKLKPYKITPVDTTGAGDSFRAGIIYGLLKGWNDKETVQFASAVAACVCLTYPHTLNAPGIEGVRQFMNDYEKL
ncbi:MAG: hypothetical protein JW969_05415 [Spirochaetales bacterium]|nr:hypothetical protein [Spirochaetales bacterium]